MNKQRISWDVKADGTLLSMPSELHMGVKDGHFVMQGTVQTEQMNLTGVLRRIQPELVEKFDTCIDSMTGLFPKQTFFEYEGNKYTLWLKSDEHQFAIVCRGTDLAVLYAIHIGDGKDDTSSYVRMVAKTLGIRQMFVAMQKGNACTLSNLTDLALGQSRALTIPSRLAEYNMLFCGLFAFTEDTVVGKAMRFLFGLNNMELALFLAASSGKATGLVSIPVIETGVLSAKELYLGVEVAGNSLAMLLNGTFAFSFLKGVLFSVNCGLGNQGFRIEAFAQIEKPVPLFHTFSIGDTCLSIGFQKAFELQMFSNLTMGKINLFAALGLGIMGSAVSLDLLSAAVTDITLPVFVESVLGKKINGLEDFDFIQLLGLPFAQTAKFPKNISGDKVAEQFNKCISDTGLALDASQVQVKDFNKGTILIDKKRMRHYFIESDGTLKLQAQFYYAVKDMKLGDYTVSKGIFLCAVLRLFDKIEFQALFSMSDKDGVTAFACIRNLDLVFLKLADSGFEKKGDNLLASLPDKSLLRQFVSVDEKGAVFYLRASASETSFYIDAKLVLLRLFSCAARIMYTRGLVSVETGFQIAGSVYAYLHIRAAYGDFSSAQFLFQLEIDCTGLEKKLKQVQDKLNDAIRKVKDKINNAKRELTQAQNHVDELYGQIRSLDRSIADCKSDIRNAKWYKRAFVAIAKGIQIAAYEVAKVALYAAIGVAKAALEVAKQIVAIGGVVGENVLKAINGAITATLNFFFVRLIRLEAKAAFAEQSFQAEIEFVALGKTYHYRTKLGGKALADNPVQALSGSINDTMDNDLKNIEKGTFRSNRNRYTHEEYTIQQHKSRLKSGVQQLESATRMMCRMQETYVDGFGEAMPEFEEMNVSYQQAVQDVFGMLDIADRSVDFEKMNQAVDMVEQEMQQKQETFRDSQFASVKSAISDYKESKGLLEMIEKGMVQVGEQSSRFEQHTEQLKQTQEQYQKTYIETGNRPEGDMVEVLNQTEEIMYEEFPVSRNHRDFINLSRETLIHEYLDDARSEFGGTETESIRKMRTRAAKGRYENRL